MGFVDGIFSDDEDASVEVEVKKRKGVHGSDN